MYQVVLKCACFLIIKLTIWSKMPRHLIYALANCHTLFPTLNQLPKFYLLTVNIMIQLCEFLQCQVVQQLHFF